MALADGTDRDGWSTTNNHRSAGPHQAHGGQQDYRDRTCGTLCDRDPGAGAREFSRSGRPDAVPFALVAQTASVSKAQAEVASSVASPSGTGAALLPASLTTASSPVEKVPTQPKPDSLDSLLERQQQAPMPVLYGERPESDEVKGDRLRAGISEVLDGGQQVIVLFSVVNTSKHAILLMPPQIQLGGQDKSGKLIKHEHWSTAEQLAVIDFRLSRRRIGPGERADGVVLFERPPYKRSMETLFLQMAESGAVDKLALAPIGFGVSTLREAANHAH